jgi:hypothetical protein
MKTFFFLLLLTNIVFALVQWLLPYEQVFSEKHQPTTAAEQLRLLQENEAQPASRIILSESEPETIPSPKASTRLCYTLGPFKDKELVQEIMAQFSRHKLEVTSRPSVEKEYLGMMVYIDGHSTRKQARETAKELANKGIRDYMIVNEEDKPYSLSLGVFGLKKNADRRIEKLKALGYQAKSEARYRNRTIYWLDYSQVENDALKNLIDRLKAEQGVSRISRVCS